MTTNLFTEEQLRGQYDLGVKHTIAKVLVEIDIFYNKMYEQTHSGNWIKSSDLVIALSDLKKAVEGMK